MLYKNAQIIAIAKELVLTPRELIKKARLVDIDTLEKDVANNDPSIIERRRKDGR